MLALSSISISLAFLAPSVLGFTFNITTTPQQCQNLTLAIDGSGTPPYSALMIPFGPSPLSSGTEVRRILDQPFEGNSPNASFTLNYPTNSQFVIVVSTVSIYWMRTES